MQPHHRGHPSACRRLQAVSAPNCGHSLLHCVGRRLLQLGMVSCRRWECIECNQYLPRGRLSHQILCWVTATGRCHCIFLFCHSVTLRVGWYFHCGFYPLGSCSETWRSWYTASQDRTTTDAINSALSCFAELLLWNGVRCEANCRCMCLHAEDIEKRTNNKPGYLFGRFCSLHKHTGSIPTVWPG